jgi:hypothetical protein
MGQVMERQAEMLFPTVLERPRWVDRKTVESWNSWRDAVLWCWANRPDRCQGEQGDQAMFRHLCKRHFSRECHAPHVSRWVSERSNAPMDLPPDLKPAFEAFTGWRGLTQYAARLVGVSIFEEVQARLTA